MKRSELCTPSSAACDFFPNPRHTKVWYYEEEKASCGLRKARQVSVGLIVR